MCFYIDVKVEENPYLLLSYDEKRGIIRQLGVRVYVYPEKDLQEEDMRFRCHHQKFMEVLSGIKTS